MPHSPKPFFPAPRGLWFVPIHGRQVNLAPVATRHFAAITT
jgi:hypothetical protein